MSNEEFKVETIDGTKKILLGTLYFEVSCLVAIPSCEQCIYSPYCRICPVVNLAMCESIFIEQNNTCLVPYLRKIVRIKLMNVYYYCNILNKGYRY